MLKKRLLPINFSPAAIFISQKSKNTFLKAHAARKISFLSVLRRKNNLLMKINEFASENKLRIQKHTNYLVQEALCCAASLIQL